MEALKLWSITESDAVSVPLSIPECFSYVFLGPLVFPAVQRYLHYRFNNFQRSGILGSILDLL